MLENDINNRQKLQFQAMSQPQNMQNPPNMQPSMQAVTPEQLKTSAKDSYVANRVSESTEDPKAMMYTAAIAVPTWYGISQGMDYYAKKSRGDFNSTVHHKIGQFGDDVTDFVKTSSFGKSSAGQSINNGLKGFKNYVKTQIIDKSRLLRAFWYTPSRPELDMVKNQSNGMWGMILGDYPQHGEQFVKPLKYAEDLDCYGATKAEIKNYKTLINSATSPESKSAILRQAEFEVISKNSRAGALDAAKLKKAVASFNKLSPEEQIKKLRDMKAFEWGYKNFDDMQAAAKNIQDHLPKVLEATNNANPKMFSRIWGSDHDMFGKAKKHLIGREVYASETRNKILGSLGNINLKDNPELNNVLKNTGLDKKLPKSLLGKFLAKYNNLVLEGATNRVGGGKFVALMQAAYLADVIYKTAKTEGTSEKFKTFAERFTEMVAFFICMPLALQLMHKVGGLQYAGMGKTPEEAKKAVAAYRKALNEHNTKAMAGEFTKESWKASKDNLKKMLNGDVKNPFVKLAKRIGRIVTVGLEQIRPYDSKAVTRTSFMDKIKDLFRHPKYGLKQAAGYPVRIALGMMIILPFLSKIAVKGSHLVFGKPKKSILDEDKKDEAAQNQQQMPPQLQNQPGANPAQNTSSNLLDRYKNQSMQQPAAQNIPAQNKQQGNQANNLNNPQKSAQTAQNTPQTQQNQQNIPGNIAKPGEPVRTYVPSPVGVQVKSSEDPSAANAALMRAQHAEEQALQALKMN